MQNETEYFHEEINTINQATIVVSSKEPYNSDTPIGIRVDKIFNGGRFAFHVSVEEAKKIQKVFSDVIDFHEKG